MRKIEKKTKKDLINNSNSELTFLVTLQNSLPSSPTSEYFGTPLIKELRIDFLILMGSINRNRILKNRKKIDFSRGDLIDYQKINITNLSSKKSEN